MDEYVTPALGTSMARVTHGCATEKRKPRESAVALEMLAEGQTFEAIRAQTGLNFTAISALRARHDTALEDRRKQLAADGFEMAEGLRLLAKQKMADLADNPDELKKVNLRDLVLPYAIAQDKAFAALGEATRVVVEHKKGVSLEEAVQAIAEARAKVRAASVEIDVTPVKEP